MIEKIKAFFQNKMVKAVCMALFCLSTAGLIIGGLTAEAVSGIVVAVVAIIAAVSALIAYIGGLM